MSVVTRARGGDVKTLLGWIFVGRFWAGSGWLEEEPGAGLADRIMLSKAMSSVRYQRSHPGRYHDAICDPRRHTGASTLSNIYKKSNK